MIINVEEPGLRPILNFLTIYIFLAYIFSKHLYKLSFKFENIWMYKSLVMVDIIQALTYIHLEN